MEDDAEALILDAYAREDVAEAVRIGVERYRAEIYSFLCARLRSEASAHEVLSQWMEDVWRGAESFRGDCSFRTWLYVLARHAAIRFERSPANRGARREGLSAIGDLPAATRSRTRPYLRTDVKDRFAALRETLSPDEQTLLVLRIDRGLSWEDVARVIHDGDEPLDVRRASQNLRQRFKQLKERLRALAEEEGLLDEEPP